MKKFSVLVMLVALTVAASSLVTAEGGRRFHLTLTGSEEIPGPGDPDGSGTATLRLNPGQEEVCFELTVSNIGSATAAHIHRGPAGVAGPVAVTLSPPSGGSSDGCVTVSKELVQEIMRNPSEFYVNVHNAEYPAGAVRGQLSRR